MNEMDESARTFFSLPSAARSLLVTTIYNDILIRLSSGESVEATASRRDEMNPPGSTDCTDPPVAPLPSPLHDALHSRTGRKDSDDEHKPKTPIVPAEKE